MVYKTPIICQIREFGIVALCFVQIIFIKHGHWACLSNKFSDRSIELFDSMHTVPTGVENGSISRQASCIVNSSRSKLVIDIIGVQKQCGGDDCGLFAISMAFDLCCGIDPFKQMVNRDDMRKHLLSCFDLVCRRLQMAPTPGQVKPI